MERTTDNITFLDTNSLIWLFRGRKDVFTLPTLEILSSTPLFFSPMARLELKFLWEVKRLAVNPDVLIDTLKSQIPLFEDPSSFSIVINEAEKITWTRDPFDRVIVAQAMLHKAPLITGDKVIRENYKRAII